MKAVIMAGGKAKRLDMKIEKPLINFNNKTLLELTINVLKESGLNKIFVAVTNNTPETEHKAREMKVNTILTPGNGYVADVQFLMKSFNEFLVVSADLPFLNSDLIHAVVKKYEEVKRPISAVISVEEYKNLGFTPSTMINNLVPIGVNIVAEGQDFFYKINGKQSINVNTKKELEMIINEGATETI